MSTYQPFKKQQPSEIREIKIAYRRSSQLSEVSFQQDQITNQNDIPVSQTEDFTEFSLKTETSLHGPKTRAAMVPASSTLKPLNSRFKTESQVFSLYGETTTSSKGLSEKKEQHFKCKSGVEFNVVPLDLSESSSCCDEEFVSDDDEMPDKPHSEESIQSTIQGQNQYYKYINEAIETRENFLNRKQVRYLGIVIEKDDEYPKQLRGKNHVYLPTKEKYMEIVKGARVLHLDELERNKNLCEVPKTMKRLKRKVRELNKLKIGQ